MREIKFRGKRKRGEGFVYGDLSRRFEETRITVCLGGNYEDVEVIPETVGQFTGLLDKNGKEIYEGDCLGIKWNVVMWQNGSWCVNGDRLLHDMISYPIVGDIHGGDDL